MIIWTRRSGFGALLWDMSAVILFFRQKTQKFEQFSTLQGPNRSGILRTLAKTGMGSKPQPLHLPKRQFRGAWTDSFELSPRKSSKADFAAVATGVCEGKYLITLRPILDRQRQTTSQNWLIWSDHTFLRLKNDTPSEYCFSCDIWSKISGKIYVPVGDKLDVLLSNTAAVVLFMCWFLPPLFHYGIGYGKKQKLQM